MSLTEFACFTDPAEAEDPTVCLAAVLRAGAGLGVGLLLVVLAALSLG